MNETPLTPQDVSAISPGKRRLRRALIVLGWIVSLTVLYYGICDWRAAHAWNNYRLHYEATVAPLEFSAYIPKPIPDDENFAANPLILSWFIHSKTNLFDIDSFAKASILVNESARKPPGRYFADLVAWQEAFAAARAHEKGPLGGYRTDQLDDASRRQAAATVLEELEDDKAALDELRTASVRSQSRFPINYDLNNPWAVEIPHLMRIKQTVRRLQLRASAELGLDQTQPALDDVNLILYLADSIKTEPFLISYLVRNACLQIALQPVREGLALHRWHEGELHQLQDHLASYNVIADLAWPLHSERAMAVLGIDLFKKKGLGTLVDMDHSAPGHNEGVLNCVGRIVPSGWYTYEKLNYCKAFDAMCQGILDESTRTVSPRELAAHQLTKPTPFEAIFHHRMMEAVLLGALGHLPTRVAATQVSLNEAAVACALERYRLAMGSYPENLEALAPHFMRDLPSDSISSQPLKYRLVSDGNFLLYSVGWNEKDDGGKPGEKMFDEKSGDWVW